MSRFLVRSAASNRPVAAPIPPAATRSRSWPRLSAAHRVDQPASTAASTRSSRPALMRASTRGRKGRRSVPPAFPPA